MKNFQTTAKPSLKDVKKSLDATQQLTADMQYNVKGGGGEDIRRPPDPNALKTVTTTISVK